MLTVSCGVAFVTCAPAFQPAFRERVPLVERVKLRLPGLSSDCLHFAYRQELPGSLEMNAPIGKKCSARRNSIGLSGKHAVCGTLTEGLKQECTEAVAYYVAEGRDSHRIMPARK